MTRSGERDAEGGGLSSGQYDLELLVSEKFSQGWFLTMPGDKNVCEENNWRKGYTSCETHKINRPLIINY